MIKNQTQPIQPKDNVDVNKYNQKVNQNGYNQRKPDKNNIKRNQNKLKIRFFTASYCMYDDDTVI